VAAVKGDSNSWKSAVTEWQSISPLDNFKDRYLMKAYEKVGVDEEDDDWT